MWEQTSWVSGKIKGHGWHADVISEWKGAGGETEEMETGGTKGCWLVVQWWFSGLDEVAREGFSSCDHRNLWVFTSNNQGQGPSRTPVSNCQLVLSGSYSNKSLGKAGVTWRCLGTFPINCRSLNSELSTSLFSMSSRILQFYGSFDWSLEPNIPAFAASLAILLQHNRGKVKRGWLQITSPGFSGFTPVQWEEVATHCPSLFYVNW